MGERRQIDDGFISDLELQILADIAAGYQSKEIASRINRSKPTVEGYVRLLCAKLGARSRAHLVACAYNRRLLDPSTTQAISA